MEKGKKKFLIIYAFLYFLNSAASDVSIEARVQGYVNLVAQGVGLRPGENSGCAQSIALIRIALGRMQGSDFSPDEETVLYLLKNNYLDPQMKEPGTRATLLHLAAFYGACKVMLFLLYEACVCIDVDHEGKSPLHWACNPYDRAPRKEVLELLVSVKKDLIYERDVFYKTPFFYLQFYSEAADYLLEVGANINVQDEGGRSPLFNFKNEENTRYLCSRGANVNQPGNHELTAMGTYLTDYCSRYDLAKNNPQGLFVAQAHELRKGIKVLIQYGCYVHRMYHPAYKMAPLKSEHLQNEKMKKVRILGSTFGRIFRDIEESLEWIKVRLELSRKSSMEGVSPVVVFDRYVSALPFFEARHREMNEILDKEGAAKSVPVVKPVDTDVKFAYFLSRLSFSKQISPEFYRMACDLMHNKAEYTAARSFSDEQHGEIGKRILEKIFPLQHPDDHTA